MSDFYEDLEVEKTATAEQIKKAYRTLAFKYHPDRNPGDKAAEEKFKKINAAYEVLGDEAKRRNYDLMGQSAYSDYSQNTQNTYQNTYSNYNPFGEGEPFWEWFNSQQRQSQQRQYQDEDSHRQYHWEYSSDNSNYSNHSYSSWFGSFIMKVVQILLGVLSFRVLIFIPFGPLISIGVIIGGVKGVVSSLRSLKRIGKNSRK